MMLKKFKTAFYIILLISLILSISACSISPPQTITPLQSSNSTQHNNPDWAFPLDDNLSAINLPDFPPVIAKVMPAVVSVTTETIISSFFGQFTQPAAGSGVIIDEEGAIPIKNTGMKPAFYGYFGRLGEELIPDKDDMVEQMREIYHNYPEYKTKTAGSRKALEKYSFSKWGELYKDKIMGEI